MKSSRWLILLLLFTSLLDCDCSGQSPSGQSDAKKSSSTQSIYSSPRKRKIIEYNKRLRNNSIFYRKAHDLGQYNIQSTPKIITSDKLFTCLTDFSFQGLKPIFSPKEKIVK